MIKFIIKLIKGFYRLELFVVISFYKLFDLYFTITPFIWGIGYEIDTYKFMNCFFGPFKIEIQIG
jgi:hypothetical protein